MGRRGRDLAAGNFTYTQVNLGSVRQPASPSPGELPLPGGLTPAPGDLRRGPERRFAWRRAGPVDPLQHHAALRGGSWDRVHKRGRHPAAAGRRPLDATRSIPPSTPPRSDVAWWPTGTTPRPRPRPSSTTISMPAGCSRQAIERYEELRGGASPPMRPAGPLPDMSGVLWGSRSGDYALADPETKATLFSEAFTESLEVRPRPTTTGVRCGSTCSARPWRTSSVSWPTRPVSSSRW